MKNKNLVIGAVVAIAIIAGIMFVMKSPAQKKGAAAPGPANAPAKAPAKAPAPKAISKDMGALTLKVMGPKNKELSLRVRAFRSVDARSAVFAATFYTGRMQELLPGNYDLEVETIPQKLYKNISVSKGRETVEDLGRVTGSVDIRVLNAKGKTAYYPVRVLFAGTATMAATITTNRAAELVKGAYDLEIGTLPKKVVKSVAIDPGKDAVIDLGAIVGTLSVVSVDGEKNEVRYPTRIRNAGTGDVVTSAMSNRSIELLEGTYDVEILSSPAQIKKGIKVEAGKEAGADFQVQAVPRMAPAKAPAAAAAKTTAPAVPAKK